MDDVTSVLVMWGYAVGAGYAIATAAGVDPHDAGDLAFRVARDELAALGHHIDTGPVD